MKRADRFCLPVTFMDECTLRKPVWSAKLLYIKE